VPGIEVSQLRVLVALTQYGGLTAAAKALGMAQSTASEAIAALERAVGAPVLLRRRKGSETILTEVGLALLPYARDVLASLASAQLAVAHVSEQARASIAISANESLATYLLPRALPGLRARWPNTRFGISIATCPGVRSAIHAGESEIGLFLSEVSVPADPLADGTACRILGTGVSLVFFAQPDHPLVAKSLQSPVPHDMLAAFPLVISDASGDLPAMMRKFFEAGGFPEPALESAGTVEGVKLGIAGDSRAVGLLPDYAVRAELDAGEAAAIRTRPEAPRMNLHALVAGTGARHPAATELLDELGRLLTSPPAH
jgi:molybdate transport repressor ModE-like protein